MGEIKSEEFLTKIASLEATGNKKGYFMSGLSKFIQEYFRPETAQTEWTQP